MAQSYLSFRELQQRVPDRTGEFYGSAIKSVGEAAGSLISDYKQAKENDLKGIYDPRKDINETVNRAHRSMALKDWGAFKDKWLPITQNQRARLSPDQLLQQRTDVEDLQKEAEYYNIQSKYMDAARKKADGIYTSFDQESMDKVMEAIDKGDKDAYMEATSGAMKTNSGTPFLKINSIDSGKEIGAIFDKLSKDQKIAEEREVTRDVNGRSVTSKEVSYVPKLDPEQQRASAYATLNTWKPEKRMAVESDLAERMSAEEQSEADALFPNSSTPLTLYNLEKRGVGEEMFVKKSEKSKPVSGSGKQNIIEPTERGWSFGSNTVAVSRDLEYIEDGEKKKKTFSNAKINAVEIKPDGSYVATAVVSVDPKEMQKERDAEENAILDERPDWVKKAKKRDKERIAEYKAEEDKKLDEIEAKYSNRGKYETIEIPLESVYSEIGDKMEDRNISLKGFNEIDFNKKEGKKSKAVEFKTKNTSKASNDDLSAIEWIRENPDNPKSKEIYDYLIEKGLIE